MRAVNRVNLARMFYLVCLSLIVGESTAQNYQGVSKSELVVGTIQDLSGPTAAYGRQLRNGLQMRANELNQQGGINGRRIKLVVEDSSGDPARAAVAVSRLIGRDHVFAVLGQMGGPQNLAAMPAEFEGNVINFLPLTGERAMYDPPSRLKVAFWPS
ncbi:MAG: ABC transporter substrate-binding protein, partial [Burkholderiaceae bacterium]